jgi:hypothetical protein
MSFPSSHAPSTAAQPRACAPTTLVIAGDQIRPRRARPAPRRALTTIALAAALACGIGRAGARRDPQPPRPTTSASRATARPEPPATTTASTMPRPTATTARPRHGRSWRTASIALHAD